MKSNFCVTSTEHWGNSCKVRPATSQGRGNTTKRPPEEDYELDVEPAYLSSVSDEKDRKEKHLGFELLLQLFYRRYGVRCTAHETHKRGIVMQLNECMR